MRDSIHHLSDARQQQVMKITRLIREELQPEAIILFGSFARGNFVEHRYTSDGVLYEYQSDYDLLVIVDRIPEKDYLLEEHLLALTGNMGNPVNLLVHDHKFIADSLEEGSYFFSEIMQEGILLYQNPENPLPVKPGISDADKRQLMQRHYDWWIRKGREFLFDARQAFDRQSWLQSLHYLHQAAENFYYTLLLVHMGYKPKTHHLYRLRRQTKNLSADLYQLFRLDTSHTDRQLFELLKQGYLDARFNELFVVEPQALPPLIEKVMAIENIVTQNCLQQIKASGTA